MATSVAGAAMGTSSSGAEKPRGGARAKHALRGFRLFLTGEPVETLPQFLVQRSVKLVSEPPSGLLSNFTRAYQTFAHEPWEQCTKPTEMHAIALSLCFFHAVVVERGQFGPIGWNRKYPFNFEDLSACANVLGNYLEDRPRVPWDDLRFVFGEIMYGGHIVDGWDRLIANAYLEALVTQEVLDDGELYCGIPLPTKRSHAETLHATRDVFPPESPAIFCLSANCAARNLALQSEAVLTHAAPLLDGILEASTAAVAVASGSSAAQPAAAGAAGASAGADATTGGGAGALRTEDELTLEAIAMLSGAVPDYVSVEELHERIEDDAAPVQHVFIREVERMNRLGAAMRRAVDDGEAALKGLQLLTDETREFLQALRFDKVPESWVALWGATTRPLASWTVLLTEAASQLQMWTIDLQPPKAVGLHYLFVPSALVMSVLQDASLRTGVDLDRLELITEVTKKATPAAVDLHARDGQFVFGPALEGAVWDANHNALGDATVRSPQLSPLPVLSLRGAPAGKVDRVGTYPCPLYRTAQRGAAITTLHLRSKHGAAHWTLRGTAMVVDPYV